MLQAPLPSPSPARREPSPCCWEPWLSGILGGMNGYWCSPAWPKGSVQLPQLGIQSCTHLSLGAGFGSIIFPVLAE